MDLMIMSLRSLAGLALVLALFALVVWAIKRLNMRNLLLAGASQANGIRICARRALDAKHSLIVVEYEGRRWMIGTSVDQMILVDALTDARSDDRPINGEGGERG